MACVLAALSGGCTPDKGGSPEDVDEDGFASGEDDCDDGDPAVHTGAREVCDGVDNDCDAMVDESDAVDAPTWYADVDGDGHGDPGSATASCGEPSGTVVDGTDCDDGDPEVHPGAVEVCDDVDNDCDGSVDGSDAADAASWYADADGDGFGDVGFAVRSCDPPSGTTADDRDCDDTSAEVNPDAVETCDGEDDDCDGEVDEDGTDAPTWYTDDDGDGYGDPSNTTVACEAPAGTTGDDTDCDDADDGIHPAGIEVCDGVDNDCDGSTDQAATDATTWYADGDGDGFGDGAASASGCASPPGYGVDGTDCDDTDAAIHPAGTEACDDRDNDCDGLVDDADGSLDLTTAAAWYRDGDGDGYGEPGTGGYACDMPGGAVANDADCDDGDGSIRPGATEMCDEVDNDCDGSADEADAVDTLTWYADVDGDGYGDADSATSSCDQPPGSVEEASDCDDADAAVNPSGVEACDGVDNDCDGSADGADSVDASTWYADVDRDGYGDPDSWVTSCTRPSRVEANASDCDDTDAAVNPDGVEVCDLVDDDCDGVIACQQSLADADGVLYGEAGYDYAGHSVAVLGDVNGDGYGDIGVGSFLRDDTGYMEGIFWVVNGPSLGETSLNRAEARAVGEEEYDELGYALGPAGDGNGDGYADFWVSARLQGDVAYRNGAVYLFEGPVSGDLPLTDAAFMVYGSTRTAACGEALTGDFDADGDGDSELLVGCPGALSNEGAAYLFLDATATAGSAAVEDADVTLTGESAGSGGAGSQVAAGDLDGDGLADLVVSADNVDTTYNNAGAAYVILSPAASMSLADADGRFTGNGATDYAGSALATPGDLDGDGLGDLLVTETFGGPSSGAVWLVPGPATGDSVLASAASASLTGAVSSDFFGLTLAGPGDVDGDGAADIVVGAREESTFSGEAGAVFLFLGPISGSLGPEDAARTLIGETAWDEVGGALAVGDIDADGTADLVMGATERSHVRPNDGAVYLVGL